MMNIKLTLEPNENGKHIYQPGHMLKGTTLLTLSRTKKFKGINIKVYGRARTHWTKQGGFVESQTYESLEVYIQKNINLVGPKDNSTFELQPGTHKYNFSYKLPENLPSSINFKDGNITYFIEVMPDVSWMLVDVGQQVKIPFAVARCDDLNLIRHLREPVKIVENRIYTLASLPGSNKDSKPLHMTVMLPHSGFVANQIVSMTVLYKNDSDVKVSRTTVTFNQKVEFRSCTIPQLKIEEYKFVEVHAEGVDAKKSKSVPISFKIPNVASSNRRFCRIITISYFIEIVGDLDREFASVKVKVPITIGGIPIKPEVENLITVEPSAPRLELLSGIVEEFMAVLPSAPVLDVLADDLPPSYQEAMEMIQKTV